MRLLRCPNQSPECYGILLQNFADVSCLWLRSAVRMIADARLRVNS